MTAGSSSKRLGERLLPADEPVEGARLRRLGDADDDARVLHREETLRHDCEQECGERERCAANTSSVSRSWPSTQVSERP